MRMSLVEHGRFTGPGGVASRVPTRRSAATAGATPGRRGLCRHRFLPTLLAVLALGVAGRAQAGSAALKVGEEFPDLAQFHLEGDLPAALRGKVVIVDFWASWCNPCKASFPVLEELHKRYGAQGLVVIAVNVDDQRAEMDAFLKQHPATFTIVRDAGKQLVGRANIGTMPTSFVVDAAGKVQAIHNGFHGEATRKQYIAAIEQLLKAKS
jgi:thiol-disulfide isomerase/thioredoxin